MQKILIVGLSLLVLSCNQPKEVKKPKVILSFKIETETAYEHTLIDSNFYNPHVAERYYDPGKRDSLYFYYASKDNYPLQMWAYALGGKIVDSVIIEKNDTNKFGALYVGGLENKVMSNRVKIKTPLWEFNYDVYHPNKYRFMRISESNYYAVPEDSTIRVMIAVCASYFTWHD